MQRTSKTPSDSYTEQIQILNQSSINGFNRLFGGRLLAWIDVVAATAARRHSGKNVTTATIDNLQFLAPAYPNDTLVLTGKLTHVGRTSMEVCVKTYVEQLSGKRRLINTAYLVLVALDETDTPTMVPDLTPITHEERAQWDAGIRRRALRKQRRKEEY